MQLGRASDEALKIIDFSQPFTSQVEDSDHSVVSVFLLTLTADDGREWPEAFACNKLNKRQMAWSVIEKETFAAIWSLKKFLN